MDITTITTVEMDANHLRVPQLAEAQGDGRWPLVNAVLVPYRERMSVSRHSALSGLTTIKESSPLTPYSKHPRGRTAVAASEDFVDKSLVLESLSGGVGESVDGMMKKTWTLDFMECPPPTTRCCTAS